MDNRVFKVLAGYDGSECAEGALSELKRCGLPDAVEALVFSVADVLAPPAAEPVDARHPEWLVAAVKRVRAQALHALEQAQATAQRGAKTLQASFPAWKVQAQACADAPGWGIVKKAEEWGADLVVVGSHSRSALGRLILGSVAQTVVGHAPCSVRVARGASRKQDLPVRLVAGEDGSPNAEAALRAIAERTWPPGSTLLLLTAIDPLIATALSSPDSRALDWIHNDDTGEQQWIHRMNQAAADKLRQSGLAVSPLVREGDPRWILVEEAERFEADCLFVGARGLRGIERFLLGSVSATVAARAHCSVEVVRAK
jgi:nucleotide-binding universal stress UspA family protein